MIISYLLHFDVDFLLDLALDMFVLVHRCVPTFHKLETSNIIAKSMDVPSCNASCKYYDYQ